MFNIVPHSPEIIVLDYLCTLSPHESLKKYFIATLNTFKYSCSKYKSLHNRVRCETEALFTELILCLRLTIRKRMIKYYPM
jgi:hypothetical protein